MLKRPSCDSVTPDARLVIDGRRDGTTKTLSGAASCIALSLYTQLQHAGHMSAFPEHSVLEGWSAINLAPPKRTVAVDRLWPGRPIREPRRQQSSRNLALASSNRFAARLRTCSPGHFRSLAHQENRVAKDRFESTADFARPERVGDSSEAVVHRLAMPPGIKGRFYL